jgi:hypothetical protein
MPLGNFLTQIVQARGVFFRDDKDLLIHAQEWGGQGFYLWTSWAMEINLGQILSKI